MVLGFDGLAKVCGFAAMLLVAHHYGDRGFGALVFAQHVTAYGLIAARCGLDLYAVKKAAREPEWIPSATTSVVVLRLVLGLLAYGLLLAATVVVPSLAEVRGLVAVFGLTFFSGALTLHWVAQAVQRTHVYGLSLFGIQALFLGLLALAVTRGMELVWVPLLLVAAEAAVALALWVWLVRSLRPPRRPAGVRSLLRLLARAFPIGGAQLLRAVAIGSDVVLVGLLLPWNEVGWYGGAYKLFTLWPSLVWGYVVVLYPHLSREAGKGGAALRREVRASLARVLVVSLPVLGLAAVWADDLLALVYGSPFAAASSALRVLLLTMAIYLVHGHFRYALIAAGEQGRDLVNVGASSAAHVVAKLALIPLLGMVGVALGTFVGESLLLVLSWRSFSRLRASGLEPDSPGSGS